MEVEDENIEVKGEQKRSERDGDHANWIVASIVWRFIVIAIPVNTTYDAPPHASCPMCLFGRAALY